MHTSVEVTNGGARAGDEIVQLYVRDDVASVARPERQLVGFARVPLEPGQAATVAFTVHPSRLAFYDPTMRYVVEPGRFTFSVGASSADIRARATAVLGGDVTAYEQRAVVATAVSLA
ncbi:MAG: fibronectin type III-like domain-contianing protein [Acidimicrobiales bacterium]